MSDALRVFVYEYLSGSDPVGVDDNDSHGMLEQGRAMRDALVSDLAALDGVDTMYGARADEPKLVAFHGTPVSALARESAAHFVGRVAAASDCVWIIAPETGGILADLCACVGSERWLGCDLGSIRTASSKRATVERLREHDVRTPRTIGGDESLRGEARWIVKPDDGAGACDSCVHPRLAEALEDCTQREKRGERVIVERWEEGDAASLSLLCGGKGNVEVLSVNRQRIDVDANGCVRYNGVDINAFAHRPGDRFDRVARDVLRALPGLRGYVGVDLVLPADGNPIVIEVNPRLTSAYVGLSAALDRNLACEVLDLHGFSAKVADAVQARRRSRSRGATDIPAGRHD